MILADKLKYYDYFITAIIAEMSDVNINEISNDTFKRLVFDMKPCNLTFSGLLFLCIAADAQYNKTNNKLLKIFNNLHAVPYGIMDIDIIQNKHNLCNYDITYNGAISTSTNFDLNYYNDLDITVKNDIYNAILLLINKNKNILSATPYDITEIVRKYVMYKIVFNEGKRNNNWAMPFLDSYFFIEGIRFFYE